MPNQGALRAKRLWKQGNSNKERNETKRLDKEFGFIPMKTVCQSYRKTIRAIDSSLKPDKSKWRKKKMRTRQLLFERATREKDKVNDILD